MIFNNWFDFFSNMQEGRKGQQKKNYTILQYKNYANNFLK